MYVGPTIVRFVTNIAIVHSVIAIMRRNIKCAVLLVLTVFISGVVYLGSRASNYPSSLSPMSEGRTRLHEKSFDEPPKEFNIDGDRDVLVFLHIQKTGGTTFGRHLVKNLDIKTPCICYKNRKRCDCMNSNNHIWLFSRYSTGWVCGLHADWTELHDCVPEALDNKEVVKRNRRYLYFTILREPIQRYLSEWKHVQRGSTWQSAKLMCNGRQATLQEVPFCFQGDDWTGVTLDEFMSCPHNLANNRQTRMLANLDLIGCYNTSMMPDRAQREQVMLQSAKDNLRSMAYFGLTEFQTETRYLFEHTFGVHFTKDFIQYNDTHAKKADVTDDQQQTLMRLNRLDLELYEYAKHLFLARLRTARSSDRASTESRSSIDSRRLGRGDSAETDSVRESYNGEDDAEEEVEYRRNDSENER